MLRNHHQQTHRRGVILLVVILMLALFTIIGLAFLLYSESEATASRIFREARFNRIGDPTIPDDGPIDSFLESNISTALGDIIYDVMDDSTGIYTAIRGHGLARLVYGWNYTEQGGQVVGRDASGNPLNIIPFNGVGYDKSALPDYNQVNFTVFFPGDTTARHPERTGTTAPGTLPTSGYFGCNAPYTYPDRNNLFLAAIDHNGNIIARSYHRDYIFGPLDPSNPNWTSPGGKRLTLRPRPNDMGPGFPPVGNGGDVTNLVNRPGSPVHDSIWIDIGLPVRTHNGKRYKPLAAPLILDLDNRLNVNLVGRELAAALQHHSNQGLGLWEINPLRLSGLLPGEFQQLLKGAGTTKGRYSTAGVPVAPVTYKASQFNPADYTAGSAGAGRPAPYYSKVDVDGAPKPPSSAQKMILPGEPTNENGFFPIYPDNFGDGTVDSKERVNHPVLYNPLLQHPNSPNWFLPIGDLKKMIADFNQLQPGSVIGQLMPNSLTGSNTSAAARLRHRLTPISFDLDRIGLMPITFNRQDDSYQVTTPGVYSSPTSTPRPRNTLSNSPFAALGQLNLARRLPDYAPTDASGKSTNPAQDEEAQNARDEFAREIFERLLLATDTNFIPKSYPPIGSSQYQAVRFLAQVAVNIVDYLDPDDVMTVFKWIPNSPNEWVVGTEVPRLVINEVYTQIYNDKLDNGVSTPPMMKQENRQAKKDYRVSSWVELVNPLADEPNEAALKAVGALTDAGAARLHTGEYAVYRLVIAAHQRNEMGGIQPHQMRSPENPTGNPTGDPALEVKAILDTFQPDPASPPVQAGVDPFLVKPINNTTFGPSRGNQGFYVLGPKDYFPDETVKFWEDATATKKTVPEPTLYTAEDLANGKGLTYTVPLTDAMGNPTSLAPADLPRHMYVLQRLANPRIPPQPEPMQPYYNPYVTVDYIEQVPVVDAVDFDTNGKRKLTTDGGPLKPVEERHARGKLNPYTAQLSHLKDQDGPNATEPGQVRNTFFKHNAFNAVTNPLTNDDPNLLYPFPWPIHLDRQPLNALELMYCSTMRPHELTHELDNRDPVMRPATTHMGKPASRPWRVPVTRLYRALELLQVSPRIAELGRGGRVPGKVNINTIFDRETFRALCDPQPSSHFDLADVDAVYNSMLLSRSPGVDPNTNLGTVTANDRPFVSYGAGEYTSEADTGINKTLLRFDQSVFVPPAKASQPEFIREELLRKINNYITTRSNTFAVFLTLGYFEVTDESVRPIKLGAELTPVTRHQYFFIVDRTNLTIKVNNPANPAAETYREAGPRPWFIASSKEAPANQSFTMPVPAVGAYIDKDGRTVLQGYYDYHDQPLPWKSYKGEDGIRVGDWIRVDVGQDAEWVQVQNVAYPAGIVNPPGIGNPPTPDTPATITFTPSRPHAPGFVISNALLGNPGPQPNFRYDDSPVVPFFIRLQ